MKSTHKQLIEQWLEEKIALEKDLYNIEDNIPEEELAIFLNDMADLMGVESLADKAPLYLQHFYPTPSNIYTLYKEIHNFTHITDSRLKLILEINHSEPIATLFLTKSNYPYDDLLYWQGDQAEFIRLQQGQAQLTEKEWLGLKNILLKDTETLYYTDAFQLKAAASQAMPISRTLNSISGEWKLTIMQNKDNANEVQLILKANFKDQNNIQLFEGNTVWLMVDNMMLLQGCIQNGKLKHIVSDISLYNFSGKWELVIENINL